MIEVKNGNSYETNYSRAAAYFLGTCAPAPRDSKRLAAYELITGIYQLAGENPSALGFRGVPDVSFLPWEQQKGREKDIKYIRGAVDKLEGLIAELFLVITSAQILNGQMTLPEEMKIGRALKKALEASKIDININNGRIQPSFSKECFEGLKELAEISEKHIIHITDGPKEDKAYLYFSRCVFEPDEDWTARAFDRVLGANGKLVKLCEELEKRGYQRIDCRDGKKISLDYVKQHGKKTEPVKMSWADKTHSGIEISYEELRQEPCFIWVRMPMFKTVLQSEEKLPQKVINFITYSNKNCDGCRYCVQTDKTHTRPLAHIRFGGKNICPMFPSFSMNWRELSQELFDNILDLVDALNEINL